MKMNSNYRKGIHDFIQHNEIGPVEIEERNGIVWNRLDWPSYVKCPFSADLSSLIKIVQDGWCLDPPQIILSILSDFQALNKWQNMEQIKKFQQGLVKAASSARTWIITNGLNIGASQITSEAIVNERNWQHSLININEPNLLEFSDLKQINSFYSKFNSDLFQQQQQFYDIAMEGQQNTQTKDATEDYTGKFATSTNRPQRPLIHTHLQKLNEFINTFEISVPIMKSVIIGVIDSNQIASGPFFYKRLDDIDQPQRFDILSGINYSEQYGMRSSNLGSSTEFDVKRSKERFCIDQNHSHFIFVQKTPEDDQEDEQLLALELFYEISYLGSWITSKQVAKPSNLQERVNLQKFKNLRIPFTAILMQGDFKTAKLCSRYLIKQIPILILQGTGGFADLLSYAYIELSVYLIEQNTRRTTQNLFAQTYSTNSQSSNLSNIYTSSKTNIPNEYLERVLKPTLTRRIRQTFPRESKETKNYVEEFFDKILECVLHANQEGIEYVTILDLNRKETKLEFLNEYLLHNYLKCRQANQSEHVIRPQDDLNVDLRLTIEWNNHKTAKKLLEQDLKTDYFTIEKSLVLDALIRKDRESFVELFLESGFKLRSIFAFDTLTWLMQKSSKNHLFLLICFQNILGLPLKEDFPMDHEFVNELNRLIFMTCKLRNFIDLNELTNRYNCEPDCLEQKALIFFTLWSVFNFNDELTRKLWPFSSYPIHLLLIISKTLTTISEYSYNVSMRKQIDEQIEHFNDQALELLDICHSKSNRIAIRTISDQIDHWNNFFAIDIASSIKHHKLIAHQSTQKWLDHKLMNGIHLKHFGLGQFWKSIKVFLSVTLVFPILIWLDYPNYVLFDLEEQRAVFAQQQNARETQRQTGDQTNDRIDEKTMNSEQEPKQTTKRRRIKRPWFKANHLDLNLSTSFEQRIVNSDYRMADINLLDKWLLLVTSPMSKYVIHFINWLFFLFFFSNIVIKPGCGDRTQDTILFFYLFVYYIEMIRKCVIKYRNLMFTNYQWHFLEFALVTCLLLFIFVDRINPLNDHNQYSYNGRMALLLLLFLSYLKLLSVFMPMYNTLAPLSYRIRMMSLHDISMFIGLVWPFMIAFGITIEASLYPDRFVFENGLTFQTFVHRTVITLFRTPYSEVSDSNDKCDDNYRSKPVYNATHCQVGDYRDANCNTHGFFSHFYLFSYIFILKFVMLTLLQALFNASMLSVEMTTIWRYQRFFLIIDFDLNYPLPPPYCVIFYIVDLTRFAINRYLSESSNKDSNLLTNRNKSSNDQNKSRTKLSSKKKRLTCNCSNESIAFFWRTLCREIGKKSTSTKIV